MEDYVSIAAGREEDERVYTTQVPRHLQLMAEHLYDKYRRFEMRALPWMNDIALSLKKYYVELELQSKEEKTIIEVKDLFKTPHRYPMLIEAAAGFGKTTLTFKILYDWSEHKSYLQKFHLVLALQLRYLTTEVKEALVNNFAELEMQKVQIEAILTDQNVKVLLILDGADEIPDQSLKYILPLIKKTSELNHYEVVITSRPGKFRSVTELRQMIQDPYAEVGYNNDDYFDQHVLILGINEINQPRFFSHYFEEKNLGRIMQNIKNVTPPELLRCPLFLLIVILVFEDSSSQTVRSKTQVFKEVLNYFVKRCISKCKGDIGNFKVLDMFLDIGDINQNNPFITLFEGLGKTCLKALKSDKVFLSLAQVRTCEFAKNYEQERYFCKLGLFMMSQPEKGLRKKTFYEPIHKSFMEYLSAYYLWLTSMKPNQTFNKVVLTLGSLLPSEQSQSLLFPFLAGLMQKDSCKLLEALQPLAFKISLSFHHFLRVLFELDINQRRRGVMEKQKSSLQTVLPSLTNFYPDVWLEPNVKPENKDQYVTILNAGMKHNNSPVKCFAFHSYSPSCVYVDTILIEVRRYTGIKAIKCPNVECRLLYFNFSGYIPDASLRIVQQILKSVIFLKLYITLHESCNAVDILRWLRSLQKITIKRLNCYISRSFAKVLLQLSLVVRKDMLHGLCLIIEKSESPAETNGMQEKLDILIRTAGDCRAIDSFSLINHSPTSPIVHIDNLCKMSKFWDFLYFLSVFIKSNHRCPQASSEIRKLYINMSVVSDKAFSYIKQCIIHVCALQNKLICKDEASLLKNTVLTKLALFVDDGLEEALTKFDFCSNIEQCELMFMTRPWPSENHHISSFLKRIAAKLKILTLRHIGNDLDTVQTVLEMLLSAKVFSLFYPDPSYIGCKVVFCTDILASFGDTKEDEKLAKILNLIRTTKVGLLYGTVNKVQLVCRLELLVNCCQSVPHGYSKFERLFPKHEGFKIEVRLFGTNPEDYETMIFFFFLFASHYVVNITYDKNK